jgi:S1-C subfamily serine protease
VLKIKPSPDLPVAVLGDSNKVRPGMTAVAIGNPFSLERTVTVGVVSSVNRTIDTETGDIIFGIIQTDASINPGNSGGPLVNVRGEIMGINSAIISPVRGSVGIGFSIPSNTAKKVMEQLIETGRVSRPYLGITGASAGDLPPELNLPEKGVLLVDVLPQSPAEKAGLKGFSSEVVVRMVSYPVGGDVLINVDGTPINTIEGLLEFLSNKNVGDKVVFGYIRGAEEKVAEVLLEERPE